MHDKLVDPPKDYNLCPRCGTEFGKDDMEFTHEREVWVNAGKPRFYTKGLKEVT
jgi:hypothetical protein